MAKAVEISVWRPHFGKFDEFMTAYRALRQAFLEAGVSEVEILNGVAGKDVGNVVVIQHFKSLTDNGTINDSMGDHPAMLVWREQYMSTFSADLVSHDLYQVSEE